MVTATGGDLVVQMLGELRELQQQLVASGERVQEQFHAVEEQIHVLAQTIREGHQRARGHFSRIIELVTRLADDRAGMLQRLDEHDARLDALERRGR